MEGEDGDAGARIQAVRQLLEEVIEHLKLTVHVDAQRLKDTLAGLLHGVLLLLLRKEGEGLRNGIAELGRRFKLHAFMESAVDLLRDTLGIRLIGILDEHVYHVVIGQRAQALGSRFAGFRIEPEVQRAVGLITEAALRVIDLHRGDTEVSEHEVKFIAVPRDLVNVSEIHVADGEDVLAVSLLTKSLLGLHRLDRIDVGRVKMPLSMELFEHLLRVAAVAEGRIHADLARLDLQHIEDFLDHDRDVHTCRGLPLLDDLLDVVLVLLRVQLLILLVEAPRILPAVALPALVLHRLSALRSCGVRRYSTGRSCRLCAGVLFRAVHKGGIGLLCSGCHIFDLLIFHESRNSTL